MAMKNATIKKVLLILTAIAIIGGLILLLLRFLLPFIYLANSGTMLKAELNNPHIDAGYEGWRRIELSSWGSCMLPDDWYLGKDGTVMQITDPNEKLIAYAAVISEATPFSSREAFLHQILEEEAEISLEKNSSFVTIEQSSFGTLTIAEETGNTCCYLQLQEYESPELFLVFLHCEESEDLLTIAQAIAFSYHFPDDCT